MGDYSVNHAQLMVNEVREYYKSKGMKSELLLLHNGSTMHCWVQSTPEEDLSKRHALVFIHGFGRDGTIWENQIATFTKDYRVFVPDLVFFGNSTTTDTQRTEIFQADCVAEMLAKLNVQETHVVGTSYGGFVAFWMAHKYPLLCRKVVLSSSGICMGSRKSNPLLKQYNLSSMQEVLLPTTVEKLKLSFSLIYAVPPVLPDLVLQQILDLFYSPEDRQHKVELYNAMVIGSEKRPPLPVLTQDVLIIWGREDQIARLPLAHELQQHLGGKCQLVVIEGAGHVPQSEKIEEYNAVVSQFLDISEGSS